MKRTYVAVTTHNAQQNGFHSLATGSDKTQVEETAKENIVAQNGNDIYAQTYLRNLRVVSKTEAKRRFGVDIDVVDNF